MKKRAKLILVLAAKVGVFLVAWQIFPGPFSHGLIVGILLCIAFLISAFVIFGRIMRRRMTGGLKPPPLPSGSWDYLMELTDLEGAPVDLSQLKGKVLVLNFWATWCAPCVAEMPSFSRLRDETRELGVEFGFITREESAVVGKFVEKRDIDLPVFLLSGEAPECFKSRAIPATFVIDKDGTIAMRHFGAAAWDSDTVVMFVRGLAAKPGRG